MQPAVSAPVPLLAASGVTKHRPRGRFVDVVLDAVSFDILPGEFLGLRGPRRSGKTTLLRIVAGIDLADGGDVIWRGTAAADLARGQRSRWLREVAFVAQPNDWRAAPGKPMLDHVALPLVLAGTPVADALSAARAVADELGVGEYVEVAPHELPPEVLIRLALARALIRAPRLLIVDDPGEGTGDADQQAFQRQLLALVRERRTLAVLLAAREASTLRGTDRIMSLDGSGGLRVPDRADAHVLPFPAGAPGA